MFALRPDLLVKVLPIMGIGMLGIFVVIGILIGVVTVLNKLAGES